MKNKIFDIPFIGYDYGKEHNWNFDVLIGKYGNPVIGIKIKNAVEQYSADPNSYTDFHTILNQVISIIGENHIIQKLDIFRKQRYSAEKSTQFLQQKYSEHFEEFIKRLIPCFYLLMLWTTQRKKTTTIFQIKDIKNYETNAKKCICFSLNSIANHNFYLKKTGNIILEGFYQ